MAKKILFLLMGITAFYLGLQICGYKEISDLVRPIITPLFIVLYMVCPIINRSKYLLGFLVLYSVAEVIGYGEGYLSNELIYYGCNSIYIASYLCLILEICSNFKIETFFKTHVFQVVTLLIFSIVCVHYLTDLTNFEFGTPLVLELFYNTVIMVMISMAMLSFFSRPNNKSMNLLIGVFCLVASEILTVAYLYMDNKLMFSNAYSILFILGLSFVFRHAYLEHQEFKFLEKQVEAL
jgi:hypothetical protein